MSTTTRLLLTAAIAAAGCDGTIGGPGAATATADAGRVGSPGGSSGGTSPAAPPADGGLVGIDANEASSSSPPPPADASAEGSAPDASGGTPIQPPLTGTVTRGTWVAGDVAVPGVTLPSGKPFHYAYLLPAGYDPHFAYPLLVHEHEDFEGSGWYDGQNGDPLYLASGSGADAWYNDVAWRTAYPCIVVLPYADQTANGGDGDDAVENFGGWTNTGVTGSGATFSGDSGPNVFAVAGLVQHFLASFSVNPQKVYVTGDSLGGIGSWYMMLMYNRVNGPAARLFTAAMPFAGVMELNGFGAGPTAAQVAQLKDVPVFAVSGAQDGTSRPQDWNQPLWEALAGDTSYPAPPQGAQAGASAFHYMEDPALGHDVWDTYRVLPAGKPLYDWLFAQ